MFLQIWNIFFLKYFYVIIGAETKCSGGGDIPSSEEVESEGIHLYQLKYTVDIFVSIGKISLETDIW